MALVWRKKRIWLVGSFASDKRIVEDSPTGVVRKDWQFSWSICVDFSDCLPVPAPKPTFRIRLRIRSNSARNRLAREKAAPRARGRFPFGRLFVPRRMKSFTGNNWGGPSERPRRAARPGTPSTGHHGDAAGRKLPESGAGAHQRRVRQLRRLRLRPVRRARRSGPLHAAPSRGSARADRAQRRAAKTPPRVHRGHRAGRAVHAARVPVQRGGHDPGAGVHQAQDRDGSERRGKARAGANSPTPDALIHPPTRPRPSPLHLLRPTVHPPSVTIRSTP